jgi:hypothetical protein
MMFSLCSMTIQCDSGEVVSASRTVVYCFGHWLGKADLAYCFQGGEFLAVLRIRVCMLLFEDTFTSFFKDKKS